MNTEETVRFTLKGFQPSELKLKKGDASRSELILLNGEETKEFVFTNLNPITKLVAAYSGFDDFEIIDQRTIENQLESGRFKIRFYRDDETIECVFDEYNETTY